MTNAAQTDERRRRPGPGRRHGLRHSGLRLLTAATALGLLLGASACSAPATTPAPAPSASPSPTPTVSVARIAITPANGVRRAKTHRGLKVTVKDGTLVSVTATSRGDRVPGELDSTSTTWRSRWALAPETQYVVRATAVDAAGRTVTKMSRFRTLTPHTTVEARIFQGSGATYGVGMPVMIEFSHPVEDRKAVESSLQLWSSKRIVGAWYWNGDQSLYFRPRAYWPANTKVRFAGHLAGVQVSPGVYGTRTLKQHFTIGRSLIAVASTDSHRLLVYKDRHRFANWPISTGRPGKDTPNGTYLSLYKENPAHMVGDDYDIQVPYSVLFTWGGDFIHAAPWSVGVQGYANVSHGCVNLAPENARTYYDLSIPGDPITVTGSPRGGTWGDGWTVWFLTWKQVLKGSALHMAMRVGPDGSTWVRPGKLQPSHAKPPLSRPKPYNAEPS